MGPLCPDLLVEGSSGPRKTDNSGTIEHLILAESDYVPLEVKDSGECERACKGSDIVKKVDHVGGLYSKFRFKKHFKRIQKVSDLIFLKAHKMTRSADGYPVQRHLTSEQPSQSGSHFKSMGILVPENHRTHL